MTVDAKIRASSHLAASRGDVDTSDIGADAFYIHGVAIGEGDITRGQSRQLKKWSPEALKDAAHTLEGKGLYVDHEDNSARTKVGEVTQASYRDGTGVVYEAKLVDEDLAEKISHGILEVSVSAAHPKPTELSEDEETGALVVDELRFLSLSVVDSGASPSNTVQIGRAEALSAADLQDQFDDPAERVGDERTYEVQVPDYDSTKTSWDSADTLSELRSADDGGWEELGEDAQSKVSDHFVAAADDGFPPERFADLQLQVVDDDGALVRTALEEAWHNAEELSGATEADVSRIREVVDELLVEEFSHFDISDEMTAEQLQEISTHTPEFSGTTTGSWDEPALEDFTDESWDDLSQEEKSDIADHYLVSKSGFPPEDFGDLALPVVEPDRTLNLSALQNAKARAGQVGGVGDEEEQRINDTIDRLANENFDASFGEDEDDEDAQSTAETDDEEVVESAADSDADRSDYDLDEVRQVVEEMLESAGDEEDSATTEPTTSDMTEEIDIDDAVEMVDGDDDHVVLDADEFDRLSEQAEMTDELSDSIDELKDRTALLDEVSRGKVEELREADDPQVVERDDYEALREEVDEMKESLASDIADEVEILDADELTENYTFESLREKHDDLDLDEESTEEELSGTPNAKTEDVESVDEELAVADDLDEAKDELGRIGWDDHADLLGDE